VRTKTFFPYLTVGRVVSLRNVAVALIFVTAGCTSTANHSRGVHQFEPVPRAHVQTQELDEVAPRAVSELLREAQQAFEAANAAQEQGDSDAALEQYSLMLDKLKQANLDPGIFYNLRSEFGRILNNTEKQARTGGQKRPHMDYNCIEEASDEHPLSERVLTEIREIQNGYPKNFQAGLDRSAKYLPYIEAELAKAGLPLDLAWLAMVESQFSPKIDSRAGAGGMWQFMRATGRRYNLRIDDYVDERYDWQLATHTAIAYLQDLYTQFDGCWPLAVSAYNMGEGGLERVIAANGGERDLWKLLEMPTSMQEETRKFYPKLLASIIVAKNPEKYGFTRSTQAPEETSRVPVRGCYSLAALDEACSLPAGTLQKCNPHLVRGVTPPSGESRLVVPGDMSSQIVTALQSVPKTRPDVVLASNDDKDSGNKDRIYVAKRGDSLSSVADKYGVSVEDLMKENRIRSKRALTVGKKLTIPSKSKAVEKAAPEEVVVAKNDDKKSGKRESENKGRIYTVKKGDTIANIARDYQVPVKELLALNNLKDTNIKVGDKLLLGKLDDISEEIVEPQPEERITLTYVVKPGDYPAKIAKEHDVKVGDLLKWNGIKDVSSIKVGEKLVIKDPKDSGPTEVAAKEDAQPQSNAKKEVVAEKKSDQPDGTKAIEHKIAPGESAAIIATKYNVPLNDLLTWNGLTAKSVLHAGDACILYVPSGGTKAKATEKQEKQTEKTVVADNKSSKKAATADAPKTAEKAAAPKTHVAAAGENASTIARKYGVKISDLYKWNNWNNKTVLQVGQKVVIAN